MIEKEKIKMENYCMSPAYERVFFEKTEKENETDYTLPEYLPNISRIVKTDAKAKIKSKSIENGTVYVDGEVVYSVLYVSDFKNKLKSAVFSGEFNQSFNISSGESVDEQDLRPVVNVFVGHSSSRMHNQRRVTAKSKISVCCDVIKLSVESSGEDQCTQNEDCDVEYLEKSVLATHMILSEDNQKSLSEEIRLDDGMPEIDEIINADIGVSVGEVSVNDGCVTVAANVDFSCLYRAVSDDNEEYVSFKKSVPFKSEYDIFEIDPEWQAVACADITGVGTEVMSDNYGENRLISLNAGINFVIYGLKNCEKLLNVDAYSTNCHMKIEKKKIRVSTFVNIYEENINAEEHLRTDLKGITSVVLSNLRLSLSNPENYDDRLSFGARGTLCVIGVKENGEIEAVQIPINIHIPTSNLSNLITGDPQKYRFINASFVDSYECELYGGELVLKINIHERCAVISEETHEVVTGYERLSTQNDSVRTKGFTIYYPVAGESVWNVAKAHHVSCSRLKSDNNVTGETFDGKRFILLH